MIIWMGCISESDDDDNSTYRQEDGVEEEDDNDLDEDILKVMTTYLEDTPHPNQGIIVLSSDRGDKEDDNMTWYDQTAHNLIRRNPRLRSTKTNHTNKCRRPKTQRVISFLSSGILFGLELQQ